MSLVVALLLLSVLTNTVSQLSLKRGITQLRGVNRENLFRPATLVRVFTNRFVLIWIALLIPSMLLWLKAISLADLSFAYPFLSLNMVFISLGSVILLKEHVSVKQWAGIGLILAGIIFISQS